jgi:hypothetical protein
VYLLGRRILLASLVNGKLVNGKLLVNGRRLLRFLGFLGGAALVSGKLNLTFFPFFSFSVRDVLFSVNVNLFSVVVNADFVFFVAALFRISTEFPGWSVLVVPNPKFHYPVM